VSMGWTVSDRVSVDVLPKCDFCEFAAGFDGKTKQGPWANMCKLHFDIHGVGLGTGLGQELFVRTKLAEQSIEFGEWMKEVNADYMGKLGMAADDLGDAPYRDYYDSGIPPAEVMKLAVSDGYQEDLSDLL